MVFVAVQNIHQLDGLACFFKEPQGTAEQVNRVPLPVGTRFLLYCIQFAVPWRPKMKLIKPTRLNVRPKPTRLNAQPLLLKVERKLLKLPSFRDFRVVHTYYMAKGFTVPVKVHTR